MTCPGIPRKACCETWTFPTTKPDEIPPWLRWKLEDPIHHACFSPDQAPGFTVFRFSHLETGPERLTETSDHRWTFRHDFFHLGGFLPKAKMWAVETSFCWWFDGLLLYHYHPLWEPLRIPLTIIKRTFPMTFHQILLKNISQNPKIFGEFPIVDQQMVGESLLWPSPDACGLCLGGAALLRPFVGARAQVFQPLAGVRAMGVAVQWWPSSKHTKNIQKTYKKHTKNIQKTMETHGISLEVI